MTGTPPSVYNGRYELRSQVARGGTAQVYLARDLLLDRPVALKVLDPQLSTDHAFVERFRREAQAAANLSHPNIVPVFDWGEADRTYFIVMEYVDGEPLSSIIRTQAPLDPEQAASIAGDIARALSYAHRHGVVHRDVKPGNVLITSDGQVKVTDFGIARAIGADEQVTQTGLVMGTATYFSPEQAQGLGVDGRSDLYALGVVLYEMVTGRPPFTGETPVSIAYQHVREIPPTPRALNPSVPVALEAIILQAMAKVPAERYATADDLRADLERFLRHQNVLAKVPSEYVGAVAHSAPETTVLAATQVNQTVRRRERERTTTPYWVSAGVVLIVALVLAVVLGGRALGYFGGGHYATVPDVRTKSLSAAESKLRTAGFQFAVAHRITGNSNDANTVTAQSPAAESSAKRNSVVELTVAGAAPMANVPSVVGLSYSKAKAALIKAGFKVSESFVTPTDPTQINNQVVKQSATGKTAKGSTITLSVVQTHNADVPDVAGDSPSSAQTALKSQGFTIGTQSQQYSSSVPSGAVIGTNPAANTSVLQGTAVSLIISQGPGATLPNVTGDSASDADTLIREAGLTPCQGRNVPDPNNASAVGQVALQSVAAPGSGCPVSGATTSPAAGSQVAPNSVVVYRVYVASGPLTTTTTTSTLPGNSGTGIGAPTTTTTTTTLPGTPPPT